MYQLDIVLLIKLMMSYFAEQSVTNSSYMHLYIYIVQPQICCSLTEGLNQVSNAFKASS